MFPEQRDRIEGILNQSDLNGYLIQLIGNLCQLGRGVVTRLTQFVSFRRQISFQPFQSVDLPRQVDVRATKKKRRPKAAQDVAEVPGQAADFVFFRFRRQPSMPRPPMPSRARVEGSGMG